MMPVRKTNLCLALLLLCSLQTLPALEVTQGNLKLVLHEGIGRFSLYARNEASGSSFTPLFVAQDPRTTLMSVIVGDRLYRLGESGEFKETTQKTTEGARFSWISDELKINEDFVFVPRGVAVRITLSNQSGRVLTAGLRLCIDTYLGEKKASHFSTSSHPEVTKELEIPKESMVRFWKSAPAGKENGVSFYSYTSGGSVTVPDKIVFANWKRLSDTAWSFASSPTRNFNLMPYSINDSAVCQYYSPRSIQPGADWNIQLLFTTADSDVAPAATAGEKLPEPRAGQPATPVAAPAGAAEVSAVYKDLLAVNSLLQEINRLLQEGGSAQELQRLQEILAALKSKIAQYSGSE
jgi:hypothetical protein